MNLSLTNDLETWIEERVKSGLYRSSSEVVREALRLLKDQQELKELRRHELRTLIRLGLDDLETGGTQLLDDVLVRELSAAGRRLRDSDV